MLWQWPGNCRETNYRTLWLGFTTVVDERGVVVFKMSLQARGLGPHETLQPPGLLPVFGYRFSLARAADKRHAREAVVGRLG
jgi:hypothetical protein